MVRGHNKNPALRNCWKDVRSNNMPWVSSLPIHYSSNKKRVCLVVFSRVIVTQTEADCLAEYFRQLLKPVT
ncbi:hypothetical protein MUK42_33747 [Musa troglodytarum]|uniref:Uncharacterized protein n=1 Tax=Musa troglodytarum TaxID=320322 RepID=A0A9E7KKK0_9LILI|nr:hypothetical protein MUK42_33747 [Musa troglodytarum]